MVKYINSFRKILLCIMMLCHNSGLLGMQAGDFLCDPVSLLKENQHLLVEWLEKEAQGTFCPELRAATKMLSKMFLDAKENEDIFLGDGFLKESVDRARYVVEAKKNEKNLSIACRASDIDEIIRIADKSPYSIQAYNCKSPAYIRDYCSILYRSVEWDYSLSVIETLLKLGACAKGKTSKMELSALAVAHNKEIAKLLIKYGADINQKNSKGENPLWMVMSRFPYSKGEDDDNHCLIDYFLRCGADLYCVDTSGKSLMQYGLDLEMASIERIQKKRGRGQRLPNYMDEREHFSVLQRLLNYMDDQGLPTTIRRDMGVLCLEPSNSVRSFKWANIKYIPSGGKYGRHTIIDYIKNNGKKLKGRKPEYYEFTNRHDKIIYDIAKLFLILKNVKKQTDTDGITVNSSGCLFQNASYDDLAQIVGKDSITYVQTHILEYCQKISHNIERTPNKYAYFFIFGYDKNIAFQGAKRMMEHKASWLRQENMPYCFEQIDENGNTLLHLSVEPYNSINVLWWFVENGIDFTIKNNDGLTALDLAEKKEDKTALSALTESIQCLLLEECSLQFSKKYKDFLSKVFISASCDSEISLGWLQTLFALKKIPQSLKYGWIKQLLTPQVPIDRPDHFGRRLMYYAVQAENKEVVLLLLSHGALIDKSTLVCRPWLFTKEVLFKIYQDQKCFICHKHFHDIMDIPCAQHHFKEYICHDCYRSLPEEGSSGKTCPSCKSTLLKGRLDFQ